MKSKQDKTLVKPTKGFLYEIRTKRDQLVGYLFGTQHKLGINYLERLHPKVLSCFDKASHVFFELENLFSNDDHNKPPTGVEHFLYRRGLSQNKTFGGLETELSRKEIAEKLNINNECSYYKEKAEGILVIIFGQILYKYNQLASLLNNAKSIEDISAVVYGVREVMFLCAYVIENLKFFPEKLDGKYFTVTDEITKLIHALGIIPGNHSNFLKEKLLIQRQYYKKHFFDTNEDKLNTLTRKYVEGDDSIEDQSIPQATKKLEFFIKKYTDEISLKGLQERDAVMAETIHNDLQMTLLTKDHRCGFYAPGAYHVIGGYLNSLPKLLKQKGWILHKVELPSVNNRQLVLSQNRFFSIDAELLKPFKLGILLEDHTRADPYGPGAIVPYPINVKILGFTKSLHPATYSRGLRQSQDLLHTAHNAQYVGKFSISND